MEDVASKTFALTGLKPATQYGFYILAYTEDSDKAVAQSKISYFTTHPGRPESVKNLQSFPINSSSIVSQPHVKCQKIKE
jgi:hypothetical protein